MTERRPAPPASLESIYWSKGGRTLVFVLQNVPIASSPTGGGGAEGLTEDDPPLGGPPGRARSTVSVDERTGRKLPDGDRFSFRIDTTEAILFCFAGPPPR